MAENADDGKPDTRQMIPLDGAIEDGTHRFTARIYYADTDFSGAVYHARYLELLERGRTDYLRCLGVRHTELESRDVPLYWVVRHMDIDFRASARIDDIVSVRTGVAQIGGARIMMAQTIGRGDTTLVGATVTAALISADGRPQRMPKDWTAAFSRHRS